MTMNNPKPSTDRAELLMQKLWEIDPMRTSCNVNPDMETEYWSQARDIIDALDSGKSPDDAVTEVFDDYFWEACLQRDGKASAEHQQIVAAIAQII